MRTRQLRNLIVFFAHNVRDGVEQLEEAQRSAERMPGLMPGERDILTAALGTESSLRRVHDALSARSTKRKQPDTKKLVRLRRMQHPRGGRDRLALP
jgi:hypothetical protein